LTTSCRRRPTARGRAELLGYTEDERAVVGIGGGKRGPYRSGHRAVAYGGPTTDAARRWNGWGTALKPAVEPIVGARKPLAGSVVANVLAHGTGALHIDACRVVSGDDHRQIGDGEVGLDSDRDGVADVR
jgi:hypothetical protein